MERNIRGTCIALKCSMDASGDGYKIIFALCEFVMIWACLSVMQYFSSVQSLSSIQLFGTPWTAVHQASMSITNSWCVPNSCPLSRGCHPTISPSVVPFSHFQSFPASGSFQMSQLFASCGQSIGVSASTWVLPLNIQDSFPLVWTGWISLQPKGLSRVFSNTTVQKHQFFNAQLSLYKDHKDIYRKKVKETWSRSVVSNSLRPHGL